MEDLIEFPEELLGFEDSGEGGISVFFVLLTNTDPDKEDRQKCSAGQGEWPFHDVCLWPPEIRGLENKAFKDDYYAHIPADLIMLAGSTLRSLFGKEDYWVAKEENLTEKGRIIYDLLTEVYGEKPKIVTLLDT